MLPAVLLFSRTTVIPVLVAAAFNNFATKNPLKFDTYAALILGRLLKYTVNRNLVIFYCLFSRLLKLGGSYHAAAINTGITVIHCLNCFSYQKLKFNMKT